MKLILKFDTNGICDYSHGLVKPVPNSTKHSANTARTHFDFLQKSPDRNKKKFKFPSVNRLGSINSFQDEDAYHEKETKRLIDQTLDFWNYDFDEHHRSKFKFRRVC